MQYYCLRRELQRNGNIVLFRKEARKQELIVVFLCWLLLSWSFEINIVHMEYDNLQQLNPWRCGDDNNTCELPELGFLQ